jgi:hypothetical protein
MDFFSIASSQLNIFLQSVAAAWDAVWWIVLPAIAVILFWDFWKLYLHVRFVQRMNWKLLEIKIPKNVMKTPKAMEQIFAAAHAPYSYGLSATRKYWKGIEEYWMSFELVGRAGESHFYLRVPGDYWYMMESAIYAQYPEAEISEAEEYMDQFPKILPNQNFDLSGLDEVLRHENYLPIRTYQAFEEPVEEQRLDPIGPIMEAMSRLREDEQLWYQLIVRPTGEDFRKEGETKISKMMGLEEKNKPAGLFAGFGLGVTLGDIILAPFKHPEGTALKKEEKPKTVRMILSSGEKDVMDGIQAKISKIAFEATPRFIYINRRGEPDTGFMNTVHGFIRQFNTQDMNSLRPYSLTSTASYTVHGFFKKTKVKWRKHLIYENYRNIVPCRKKSILNIEELATIFHFPITAVSTTELEKIASRKGSPPASVPIIEE